MDLGMGLAARVAEPFGGLAEDVQTADAVGAGNLPASWIDELAHRYSHGKDGQVRAEVRSLALETQSAEGHICYEAEMFTGPEGDRLP
jgi:hypothetical protein